MLTSVEWRVIIIIYFIFRGVEVAISYKKLWKMLIDRDMKKKDLQAAAGISSASVTKLAKMKMSIPKCCRRYALH